MGWIKQLFATGLKSLVLVKSTLLIAAGIAILGIVWAILSSFADAAVLRERNGYLMELHEDRNRIEQSLREANEAAASANQDLMVSIEELRLSRQSRVGELTQCPIDCYLQPVC